MTRKRLPKGKPVALARLVVPLKDAEAKLRSRIEKGRELAAKPIRSTSELDSVRDEYANWLRYNRELLLRIFSNPSVADEHIVSLGGLAPDRSFYEEIEDLRRSIDGRVRDLESIFERLDLLPQPDGAEALSTATVPASKVFVVHGHDESARESVARYIERLGLEAVILHEQPNAGRTIIEKFESHADVRYAVVLLTPDDVGAAKSKPKPLNLRARQNVIFEMGYFYAKLGRHHVCALYSEGVELPSDVQGIVYVPLDSAEAWHLRLARELRGAGLAIDINKAL
jgi:predicted nucleotide-binding protein